VYRATSPDDVRAQGFPGADDLANMFFYYAEHEEYFAGVRDPEYVRTINPRLEDFATWLTANRDKFLD
jgi:hypothetical protein